MTQQTDDFRLCSANGSVVLIAGANANNGANVGRFYGNWNNSASNANWNIAALHFFLFVSFEAMKKDAGRCIDPTPW